MIEYSSCSHCGCEAEAEVVGAGRCALSDLSQNSRPSTPSGPSRTFHTTKYTASRQEVVVVVVVGMLSCEIPGLNFKLVWGVAGSVELEVSSWNRDELLLNVNAVGPLVSCDSLESPSKLLSLTR